MSETIQNVLNREGFALRFATNGATMREQIAAKKPLIVLLDLILPDESGLNLARELQTTYHIPFIIISGKGDVIDKVVGLEIGADDYISKPFHARELVARLNAVIRRISTNAGSSGDAEENDAETGFIIGDWNFDHQRQLLKRKGADPVNLTTHEFRVLKSLVDNAGMILSRDSIIDMVSGRDWMPFDRSVDVVIGKLRKKLDDNPACPVYIKTIRNAGYSFVAKVKKI